MKKVLFIFAVMASFFAYADAADKMVDCLDETYLIVDRGVVAKAAEKDGKIFFMLDSKRFNKTYFCQQTCYTLPSVRIIEGYTKYLLFCKDSSSILSFYLLTGGKLYQVQPAVIQTY